MYKVEEEKSVIEDEDVVLYGIADENRFYFSFTQDKKIAEEMVILLNENQVAPCHIADIIEDMFYSG